MQEGRPTLVRFHPGDLVQVPPAGSDQRPGDVAGEGSRYCNRIPYEPLVGEYERAAVLGGAARSRRKPGDPMIQNRLAIFQFGVRIED